MSYLEKTYLFLLKWYLFFIVGKFFGLRAKITQTRLQQGIDGPGGTGKWAGFLSGYYI